MNCQAALRDATHLEKRGLAAVSGWRTALRRMAPRKALALASGLGLVILLVVIVWWLAAHERGTAGSLQAPSIAELTRSDRLASLPALQQSPDDPPPLVGTEAMRHNASAPLESLGPAAKPFRFAGDSQGRARARACLAAAMFYEAGDDGIGQLAVGQVILNRARHPAFPKTVCGVVTQGSTRSTGCQFTFTCDGALARQASLAARSRALLHADLMLDGLVLAGVGLATHYHTDAVYPWWSPKLEKIARVGAHLFFRWPGFWGSAAAVLPRGSAPEPSAALFARFMRAQADEASLAVASSDAAVVKTSLASTQALGAEIAAPASGPGASLLPLIPASRRLIAASSGDAAASPVIGAAALGGNRLLHLFPQADVFHLQLIGPASQAARRRMAETLCGGRAQCRVYGWNDPTLAPDGPELDAEAKRALAFSYIRTPSAQIRTTVSAVGAM